MNKPHWTPSGALLFSFSAFDATFAQQIRNKPFFRLELLHHSGHQFHLNRISKHNEAELAEGIKMSKPSRKYPITAIIGAILLLAAFISLTSTVSALIRGKAHAPLFAVPGSFKAETQEDGQYYVWNHYKVFFEGESIKRNKKFPNGLTISVQDSKGTELPFTLDDDKSWGIGNHAKTSIGYVEAKGNKTIQISVTGSSKQNAILSFAPADVGNDLWISFRGLLITVIGALLGLPLLLWALFFFRRQ